MSASSIFSDSVPSPSGKNSETNRITRGSVSAAPMWLAPSTTSKRAPAIVS